MFDMRTQSKIGRSEGAAMSKEADQWERRRQRVTRMDVGLVVHNGGDLLHSAIIKMESKHAHAAA